MRITIDVTRRDINQAAQAMKARGFDDCPITRALRRALGVRTDSNMGQGLAVSYDSIYFYPDDMSDEVVLATMPPVATDFVNDSDDGIEVAPFSFVANFNKARAKRIGLALPGVAL